MFDTSSYVAYVTQLYKDVLGRPVEQTALEGWLKGLENGMTAFQLASAIWVCPEHCGLQVDHYYQAYLNRSASPQERASWVDALTTGMLTDADAVLVFLTSPEYSGEHASNQAFITALYNDVLLRPGSNDEVALWQGLLDSGTLSRDAVAAQFVSAPEAVDVDMNGLYRTFLRRSAAESELQSWLSALASGQVDWDTAAALVLSSGEYLHLAGVTGPFQGQ
jgi:hypothetical protein